MRYLRLFAVVVAVSTIVLVRFATAVPQFQKVFFTEYIDDHDNSEFAEMVARSTSREARMAATHNCLPAATVLAPETRLESPHYRQRTGLKTPTDLVA